VFQISKRLQRKSQITNSKAEEDLDSEIDELPFKKEEGETETGEEGEHVDSDKMVND